MKRKIFVKTLSSAVAVLALLAVAGFFSGATVAAGDPAAGAQKAGGCVSCHGDKNFPGLFFTLQLAGRDADKLTIKTNRYRKLQIINPIMNMVTVGLNDQDVEDISAYYHSLEKPAFVNPLFPEKGDDEIQTTDKVSEAPATYK